VTNVFLSALNCWSFEQVLIEFLTWFTLFDLKKPLKTNSFIQEKTLVFLPHWQASIKILATWDVIYQLINLGREGGLSLKGAGNIEYGSIENGYIKKTGTLKKMGTSKKVGK
jgi:hypothetical protein